MMHVWPIDSSLSELDYRTVTTAMPLHAVPGDPGGDPLWGRQMGTAHKRAHSSTVREERIIRGREHHSRAHCGDTGSIIKHFPWTHSQPLYSR